MTGSDISRYLPINEYNAAIGANAPSASNVFVTTNTLGAHGLPQVLAIDNTTGPNDISVDNGQVIKGTSSQSFIDLDEGPNGAIQATSNRSVFLQGGDFINNINTSAFVVNDVGTAMAVFKNDFAKYGQVNIVGNSANDVIGFNIPNYPTIISTQNYTVKQNVDNTVLLGGKDIVSKTNNTAYVNQVGFNTGLAGEMILAHTPNAGNFTATLKAETGTIALLSDITGTNSGTNTGDQSTGTTFPFTSLYVTTGAPPE